VNFEELNNEISDIQRDRPKQVALLSEYILNQKKIFNPSKALAGGQLYEEYIKLKEGNDLLPNIPQSSFIVYLSIASNSADSKINCEGKRQGYYIDRLFEKIEESTIKAKESDQQSIEQEQEEQKEAKEKGYLLEKDLYPFLEKWLFQIDNERVSDISANRKHKKEGRWANPDLVGLKIDNLFGATEVEITTIEAKLTLDNWEQNIFEAIAHTIFSNRSYFAFVHSEGHVNKIPPDLKHYAERFKVGILIIALDPNDYLKVKKKEKFALTDENHKFLEYSPAPYNSPHVKFKKRFLEGLEIREPADLFRFGKVLDK